MSVHELMTAELEKVLHIRFIPTSIKHMHIAHTVTLGYNELYGALEICSLHISVTSL